MDCVLGRRSCRVRLRGRDGTGRGGGDLRNGAFLGLEFGGLGTGVGGIDCLVAWLMEGGLEVDSVVRVCIVSGVFPGTDGFDKGWVVSTN